MAKPQPMTKVLQTSSERVKSVEIHPKEPLVLCALYTGQVTIWNFETSSLVKAFDVVDSRDPVRIAKWIPRLNSFVCGSDDLLVRVFNYNTMEKTKTFEAHQDYIRAMAVHDVLPYLLTCSDDMSIRMWDWSKNWTCAMVFESHTHYVMSVVFNPKDSATFASGSLDGLVMVWSITSNVRNFTLEGHEAGVNCVEYFGGGDKPYLASGSDDHTVRVWDYQTKACLQVLSYHEKNISCIQFHPALPLLFAGSEDETVSVFSTQTWRLDQSMNFGLERIWSIACKKGSNHVAIACDRGMVVLRVGAEEPCHSMDNQGKILVSSNTEILRLDVKQTTDKEAVDGEVIQLPSKEMGSMESAPTKIIHSPNGQYAAVLFGEDEYTINSTLAWRPKCFGKAVAFAWGPEAGTFAILENHSTLKVFKQFKQKDSIKMPSSADQLYSGSLLGVRVEGAVLFLDWEKLSIVRRIVERVKSIVWSDSGELVAIMTDEASFILKCNLEAVEKYVASGASALDGADDSFDIVEELENKIRQAIWVGDCLVFCDMQERLNFYIGGEISSLAVLPRNYFILGYVARDNKIYCMDRERNVVSFHLHTSQVEYLTAIVREDFDAAEEILPRVPEQSRYKIARLLQSRELPHIAITVTTDDDHKFELAVILKRLDVLQGLIEKDPSQTKWRQLGDIALQLGHFDIAEDALLKARDYNGLLLLHTCTANSEGLQRLAHESFRKKRFNVAFSSFHTLRDHSRAIDCLIASGMFAEAAFYARTYDHTRIMDAVGKWRHSMTSNPKLKESIADPETYPNLFPGIDLSGGSAAAAVTVAAAEEEQEEQEQQQQQVVHQDPAVVAEEEQHPQAAAPAPAVKSAEDELFDDEEENAWANNNAAAASSPPPATEKKQEEGAKKSDMDDIFGSSPPASQQQQQQPAPAAAKNEDDELFGDEEF